MTPGGTKLPLVEKHSPREEKEHCIASHLGGRFLPPCGISQSFTLSALGEWVFPFLPFMVQADITRLLCRLGMPIYKLQVDSYNARVIGEVSE